MLKKIKSKLKGPVTDNMYAFLMREAKLSPRRQLFGAEELKQVTQALLSQNLFGIDGQMVPGFEKEFARSYGVPYAVASTSGTAAIHSALGVLDLNPGDEIITAPITDMGTIIPILYQQAIPVFADIDETYNMDPNDVERKITDRTKAIIVVHLFGNPCDMNRMVDIAKRHNIVLIEDCAQAHMTEYDGRFVGTFGDIGCFSFQQAKHMTTGDGGMAITSNKAYYEQMKLFVDKNYARKGWGARAYLSLAPNYRMNELTGAVGLAQLKKVRKVVQKRHELGQYLSQLVSDIKEVIPAPVTRGAKHSYWLYPLSLRNLDINLFVKEMSKEKIWVSAGYTGKPIYLCAESLANKKTHGNSQCPFTCKYVSKSYEYKEGLCPVAEEALKHLICIPLNETWEKSNVEKAATAIKASINNLTKKCTSNVFKNIFDKEPAKTTLTNSAKKTIRIGIVGCGQMGRWHLESYRKNQNVELVAFSDIDFNKAQSFAKNLNAKAYPSHSDMLMNERLDGVSICTIPSTHLNIALDLLSAGINVLCEKPLATSTAQAIEMIEKAKEKNLLILSAFKFRFFDEVLKAKELIDKGGLGKILSFRLMFGGYINMSETWYAKKELSGGGIIMDTAPHAIDLIRYLFGEMENILAQIKTFQDIEVEDTAQLSVSMKNGSVGTIDLSWSVSVPSRTYLEIYGQDGTILLDSGGITYKFKTWDDWKRVPNQSDTKEAFARQASHFIDAIVSKKPLITINDDGLKSQIIIESAYESSVKNDRVYIPAKEMR